LLLTDIPPCRNLTAGLALAQLCRFLPRGSLACFTILNRHLHPELCPDLDWIPMEVARKPNEYGRRVLRGRLGILTALPIENCTRWISAPRLVARATRFARAHNVDLLWAVLQGQTVVRVAGPLARNLGVPLLTQVWDPLSWWLRAHEVDPWNRWLARRQFDAAIRQSGCCMTASWVMAEQYENMYGVRCVPMLSCLDSNAAMPVAEALRNQHEIVIGMAGQFYAEEEWNQLLAALHEARWRVAGRSVRIKVLGPYVPPGAVSEPRLDYRGWKPTAEAIKILAQETDVLYCPYPFAPEMDEVARVSFPSKIPLYFAAGRPILFHGPAYSSPGRYLIERKAAVICKELSVPAIYNELERLVTSPALYAKTALNGRSAFLQDFTLDQMRERFLSALGTMPQELAPSPLSLRHASNTR
jgi:hypothetical protein